MRTIAAAALGLVTVSLSFAQGSLCNPCVDPPVQPGFTGPNRTLTLEPGFNLGEAVSNLRSVNRFEAAAVDVMPKELSSTEIRAALAGGLWREDRMALAVTLPSANATLAYVFVRQPDGSYAGTDATPVILGSAFGYFGWPAAEYERYEIELLSWEMRDGDPSLLRAQVRAWRQGQRYMTGGNFFVSPDGSITSP